MSEAQALLLAFLFGIAYNWLITRWVKSGYGDGFTALWVVIGVFVTLLISSFVTHGHTVKLVLEWQGQALVLSNQQHAAWYELKFFIAAGIPMFVGSLWRYLDKMFAELDFTVAHDD